MKYFDQALATALQDAFVDACPGDAQYRGFLNRHAVNLPWLSAKENMNDRWTEIADTIALAPRGAASLVAAAHRQWGRGTRVFRVVWRRLALRGEMIAAHGLSRLWGCSDVLSEPHPLWDGETLAVLLAEHGDLVEPLLWQRVPDATVTELAHLYLALSASPDFDVDRFFACSALDTPPDEGRRDTVLVGRPPGEGQPRGGGRIAFQRTPVTRAMFLHFHPQHRDAFVDGRGRGGWPVTAVSWWVARLYAAWVGGRLPLRSEWMEACRSGSDRSRFRGRVHGWRAGRVAAPVTVRRSGRDAIGLFGMLGNVREWCEDRAGARLVASLSSEPNEAPRLSMDPIRHLAVGGSFIDRGSDVCCEAYKALLPSDLLPWIGFRVVWDVP